MKSSKTTIETAEAHNLKAGVGHHSFTSHKEASTSEKAAEKIMSIADQWWEQINMLPYELRYEIIHKLICLSEDNMNNVPRVHSGSLKLR